jgi:hypothetical protein
VFSQLLHVECVQLAAAFGSQSSLPIEKQSGSKLHALHMSAQISLSPAKHTRRHSRPDDGATKLFLSKRR